MSRDKLYKCPYCEIRLNREDLLEHISDKHDDLIPDNYSPFRVMYDFINCKNPGYESKCVICNKTAGWNDDKGKYNLVCKSKACKEKYLQQLEANRKGNPGFNDAEVQEKLLANRKISGVYKFSDGVEKTYTGSYEKKCLEFLDKILHVNSEDILAPGVILEYEYEGKKKFYISDFYYVPYNLIIEVKDGGDNPNRKDMIEYRNKTTAKEKFIIDKTNYNYLRLTDNNFNQLLAVFFELKMNYLDGTCKDRVIHINQ